MITQDMINNRKWLTQVFIDCTITEAEAIELVRILEEEKQDAAKDGDIRTVYSIKYWIWTVNRFIRHGRNPFCNLEPKPSL